MVVYLCSEFNGEKPHDNGEILERDPITGQPTKIRQYLKRKRKRTGDDVWSSYVLKTKPDKLWSTQHKVINKRQNKYVPRNFRNATIKQRAAPNFQKKPVIISYKKVLFELYSHISRYD
jgi:hypothetical protein